MLFYHYEMMLNLKVDATSLLLFAGFESSVHPVFLPKFLTGALSGNIIVLLLRNQKKCLFCY